MESSDFSQDTTSSDAVVNTLAPSPFVFWRRIFAYAIDSIFLGIFGTFLGACFFHTLAGLGQYGRLVGFAVCLFYFGFLNSGIGHGQTIGKRIMKIKVVSHDGNYISISQSIVRAAILCLPGSLNCMALVSPGHPLETMVVYGQTLIMFGVGAALVYLFLFNRPSRQSAHDLAVGSFVVNCVTEELPAAPVWRGHLLAIPTCCILILVGQIIAGALMKQQFFSGLLNVQQTVQSSGGVSSCSIFRCWEFNIKSPHNKISFLKVNAVCLFDPFKEPDKVRRVASLIIKSYPDIMKLNGLSVSLSYGYDLGIASFFLTKGDYFSADDLKSLQD